MKIPETYHRLMTARLNQASLDALYLKIDQQAAQKMKEAGFSQDAAKEFFFKHCPYVRHQPRQQAEELFRQILPPDMKDEVIIRLDKVTEKTLGDIYWQTKEENAENFRLVYQEADMAAINALLDMGFTSRTIDESYELNSFFAAEIENEPLAIDYENEIKRNVTEERELKSLDEGKEAKIALQKISVSNRHKFAGNDKEYALYNNGQTVLALLLQEGFMPETVRAVMESTVKDRDRLEKLMEECGRVKIAYQEIKEAPEIDDAGNMPDTYRAYAKIYMQRHHLNQLSFTDDCQIIKDMKEAEGYPDEFLRNALRVASPVVREPGRDTEKSIAAIMDGEVNLAQTMDKKTTMENIVAPSDIYKNFITESHRYMIAQGLITAGRDDAAFGIPNAWRPYYDALAARKILAKHFHDKDVLSVLKTLGNPDNGKRDNYGQWMVDKAKRTIKAEQNLLAEPKEIPSGQTYAELIKQGIEPLDIYRSILREKLEHNPSLRVRLFEESLDKDMAETCLTRYPDFDKEALSGIIAAGPRAALVNGLNINEAKQYETKVMREVERRINEYQEERQATEQLKYEFNRQRGLAYQGVEAQNADPAYQFGRSAVMLMVQGFAPMDIRAEILQGITPEIPIKDRPETFADRIIDKAEQVYSRLMAVKNWHKSEPENAAEDYLTRLSQKYQQHGSIRPSTDIEIIRDMLLAAKYSQADILTAVTEHSPIAIEPGRDKTYVSEYLLPRAQNEAKKAQEKLEQEKPLPRENPLPDLHEEYAFQRQALQARHPLLPYSESMEELIAATLFQENFAPMDIAQTLDNESPFAKDTPHYGQNLLSKAHRNFIAEHSVEHYQSSSETHSQDVTITRSRTLNQSTGYLETATETVTNTTTIS